MDDKDRKKAREGQQEKFFVLTFTNGGQCFAVCTQGVQKNFESMTISYSSLSLPRVWLILSSINV